MIEIKGVQFQNKGAELMLLAVIELLKRYGIKRELAIAPIIKDCMYRDYARLGIYQKVWLSYKGLQIGGLGCLIPQKLREMYGLVLDNEINVVLDASGFAYSDQWGVEATELMARYSKKWKKSGKKIILLPQAFGPFENREIRKYIKEIVENSDLIYARDSLSYEYLSAVVGKMEKIKTAPDFTVVIEGIKPQYAREVEDKVCLVPNQRMIDKVGGESYSQYVDLLSRIVSRLQENQIGFFFMIHGGEEDYKLATEIVKVIGGDSGQIITEQNVLFIKGIIKSSLGVIGSRYHALASALYSGKVGLGIGWSHKYQMLYDYYGFNEGILAMKVTDDELEQKLAYIIQEELRTSLAVRFLEVKNKQMGQVFACFEEVAQLLTK